MTAVPLTLYLARRDGNRDDLSGGLEAPRHPRGNRGIVSERAGRRIGKGQGSL